MLLQQPQVWDMQFKTSYNPRGDNLHNIPNGAYRNSYRPFKPHPNKHAPGQAHFDPDELTRRLYLVLAERKALAERRRASRRDGTHGWGSQADTSSSGTDLITQLRQARRRSRMAAEEEDDDESDTPVEQPPRQETPKRHSAYVPQQAAKQFARTTTIDAMRVEESQHSNSTSNSSTMRKLSKRSLQQPRHAPTESSQTQHTRIPEDSDDRPNPYTFEQEYCRIHQPPNQYHDGHHRHYHPTDAHLPRRAMVRSMNLDHMGMSHNTDDDMDNQLHRYQSHPIPLAHQHQNIHPERRVDWTQSDETGAAPPPAVSLRHNRDRDHHSHHPHLLRRPKSSASKSVKSSSTAYSSSTSAMAFFTALLPTGLFHRDGKEKESSGRSSRLSKRSKSRGSGSEPSLPGDRKSQVLGDNGSNEGGGEERVLKQKKSFWARFKRS